MTSKNEDCNAAASAVTTAAQRLPATTLMRQSDLQAIRRRLGWHLVEEARKSGHGNTRI